MKPSVKVLCCTLLGLYLTIAVNGDFLEMTQYHRMPKLSEYDDYDQCMEEAPVGQVAAYCMARVVIKPDSGSELWRLIEDFSSDRRRHYNHALLDRGICIDRCKKIVQGLSNTTRQALMVDKFEFDFPYIFDVTAFKETTKDRERYEALIGVCINYQLNQTYRLKAYTEIEVCDKNTDVMEVDWLDMSFLVILVMIIGLLVLSSWYDKTINYKQDVVHYKHDLDSKKKMTLVSFSILRNWYRLTSRSQEPLNKDLRFFQAIRFFTMYLVIMGHAALLSAIMPTQNTSRSEKMYHNIGTMLLTGGVQITQTFFAMSGVLLAIHIMTYAKQRQGKIGLPFLAKAIVYRYIRLTPVYAFVILLHATWLAKLEDGPIWKRGSETERVFCRRNWWTNLLYVNNYVNADQPCVQQAWYLGCDYQLFIVGSLILILINRFRKLTIPVIVVAVIGSYVLPAMFIYYQRLEGVFVVTLEAQRFVLWFDEFYQKSYIPFHINTGNYLAGMVTGLIYLNLQKKQINPVEKKWFRVIWHLVFPVAIGSLLVHYMFYVNEFEKPSVWMAIYFPVMKNAWGIFSCIFIVGFVFGIAPIMRRIFDHRIFEPMGRITYTAYLSHVFVMRLVFLSVRAPVHFNHIGLTTAIFASVVFSYLLAIFLCLTMELPVSALQKQIFGSLKGESNKQVDPEVPNGNANMKNPETMSNEQERNNNEA